MQNNNFMQLQERLLQQAANNQYGLNNNNMNQNFGYQLPILNGDPLADDVQGNVRQRTHLIQLYTHDPDEGPRLISDFHPQGVPIMVIVDPPSCCYFKLNIPHGIVSLEQKWGKYTGQMTPGYHMCYCSHKRIAAMITKNSVLFNTPIEACPTKDNVRVSVDIGITFHIGKEGSREKDCEQFLYYLGANKLEELLEQESEEKIRIFIRTIKVNQIRDIKSELTTKMMAELNSRFNNFGVYVEQVNVMNVIIPKDLRIALQQATAYDVFLQKQVRSQENVRLRMMNDNNMKLLTLKRENQKKMLELNSQQAMEEIYLQKFKVNSETQQQINIITATQKQQIKIIQADAIKSLAEKRAQKQAETMLAEAKAYSEGKRIQVSAKKINLEAQAKVRYESAKQRSAGILLEADAETDQANNLDLKRKHEQRMKKTDNMRMLMKDNNIIIGGENGEKFLDYFNQTGLMVDENQL